MAIYISKLLRRTVSLRASINCLFKGICLNYWLLSLAWIWQFLIFVANFGVPILVQKPLILLLFHHSSELFVQKPSHFPKSLREFYQISLIKQLEVFCYRSPSTRTRSFAPLYQHHLPTLDSPLNIFPSLWSNLLGLIRICHRLIVVVNPINLQHLSLAWICATRTHFKPLYLSNWSQLDIIRSNRCYSNWFLQADCRILILGNLKTIQNFCRKILRFSLKFCSNLNYLS